MDVRFKFCEQLATSSEKQFVASRTNKLQLHDPFITLNIIYIGDKQTKPIFIGKSIEKNG
jgi:hypothetical protein